MTLPSKAYTPLKPGYRPETDTTDPLNATQLQWFQSLIGSLRWIVELGRVDIANAVSLLSSFLATPRTTHLQQALHIFSYLKRYSNPVLMMDLKYMRIEEPPNTEEWNDFYPSATEPIPSNAPPPLGNSVSTTCFVDADWAGDKVNRRSHTGILLFVNRAPITWISKKQSTVETSTHGAELVASRLAVDTIDSLRYKLRMFGIPIAGPTTMWCDNMSVVHNGTRPDSTLKRKHNSISYHRIREAVAAGYIVIRKIETKRNLAMC